MPTIVRGGFEWDVDKAESNLVKHDVSFEEAALAMTDPLSVDFDDSVETENLITLAASPMGRILYVTSSRPCGMIGSESSALATQLRRNDDVMTKQNEPSAASLDEMPEIDDQRFRRRAGRGHHIGADAGEIVSIDADLWTHFGSADAVNDALRKIVADAKKASGS